MSWLLTLVLGPGLVGCTRSSIGNSDLAVVGDGGGTDLGAEVRLSGAITSSGAPVSGARVTVVGGSYFAETRSDARGEYAFAAIPDGTFDVGASALGLEYEEASVTIAAASVRRDIDLAAETHAGEWQVIGDTEPDRFGGTNSGVLMSDGRIIYCHETIDPVVLDPVSGQKSEPKQSPALLGAPDSEQGCHQVTHLIDGRVLYVAGGTVDDAGNFSGGERAINVVKAFDPRTETWEVLAPLREVRWYAGLGRLSDGKLLLFAGGQQPTRSRTDTAEIYDPVSKSSTPTTSWKETDFGPNALLFTGELLVTWFPPTLYEPTTQEWRATGNFVQQARGFPDHSDHTLVVMADGRAAVVGIKMGGTSMIEIYDPSSGTWKTGASPATLRSRAEVLQLPDKRIFVAGGQVSGGAPAMTNAYGYTNLVDLYDEETDRWRALAPMVNAREYHAITLLVPDGRVVVTAGVGAPGLNPPAGLTKEIVAFSPPYLFRGPRPRIDAISSTDLSLGGTVTLQVSNTVAVTAVRIIGMNAITHFVDGGVPRLLDLSFTQSGSTVTVQLPSDRNRLMLGHYLLFAMVDDIPSVARIVRAP